MEGEHKAKGWPAHSSQRGLIDELLQGGVPVTLSFNVTELPKRTPQETPDDA